VWSAAPSRVAVGILPTLIQTWWFRALGMAVLLCTFAWAYSRRLAHVGAQIKARLGERERIARELHDTLLQSMHALVLQINAVGSRVSDLAVGRDLGEAAASVEKAITEGRDKVRYLRFERRDARADGLPCPIGELLAEAAVGLPVTIIGPERELTSEAAIELQSIVREMAMNATRHARASVIEVRATFHGAGLTVGVYDNGIGIGAALAASGNAPGHWGLAGMRERAKQLGGKLTVMPVAAGGTAAEVFLPGRRIYRPRFALLRSRERR
jgi:signal transduction histidine kinase